MVADDDELHGVWKRPQVPIESLIVPPPPAALKYDVARMNQHVSRGDADVLEVVVRVGHGYQTHPPLRLGWQLAHWQLNHRHLASVCQRDKLALAPELGEIERPEHEVVEERLGQVPPHLLQQYRGPVLPFAFPHAKASLPLKGNAGAIGTRDNRRRCLHPLNWGAFSPCVQYHEGHGKAIRHGPQVGDAGTRVLHLSVGVLI